MCTDARQYAMQQQGNAPQPIYHHQQMPAQLQQYQAQPTYQTQPQYVISQGQPPPSALQDRQRQNVPNEQMQQNIYHQQIAPGLPQNVLYHQQQIQNHYSLQPTMHRSPPTNPSAMPPQSQMHPQPQGIYSQNNAAAIMSGAATLRRQPPNTVRDMDPNPNPNLPDNAMYERDKQQIFKYSTLRQGGKFDPRNFGPRPNIPNGAQIVAPQKPSILNCPLPEIPKEHATNGNDLNNAVLARNLNTNGAPNINQAAMTR